MDNVLGSIVVPKEIITDVKKNVGNFEEFKKNIAGHADQNTTNLLDAILCGAVQLGSSDVHIEPQEDKARLRIRIDGILQDAVFFSQDLYHHLLSRIKLLSKIKLNITDKPQDGRFTMIIEDLRIEIRTSTLPAEYGESIAIRILNPKSLIQIDDLGLRQDLYDIFLKEIKKPNGMIIVTGPTGAGKTTTLYAFLMKIQSPEIKIITIEDPIEYHIQGVSQTQVAPEKGYSFSEGLRSIVRQDPDVILVGEIRDLETAKISLQAALTGHLVLSTLHTNDAAGTIPRLIDLGAEASSVAPAVKMVVAQRLARKVCQECVELSKSSPEELHEIKSVLKGLEGKFGLPKKLDNVKLPKAKGCKACGNDGYKGRKGIFEVFLVDADVEKFILTNPAVSAIKDMLVKKGMITMYQAGLIEVVLGETTLEEIKKVISDE